MAYQLSKAELWALGEAFAGLAKHPKASTLRVSFSDEGDIVPSHDGHVLVGDLGVPKTAIRIDGGDADNLFAEIRGKPIGEGNCEFGLRLRRSMPVRWESRGSFVATQRYNSENARVGFWTPGFPMTKLKAGSIDYKRVGDKAACPWGPFVNDKLAVVVGIDADDQIACVIAGDTIKPSWFALGKKPIAPPTRAARKAVAAAAVAEEAEREGDPLPPRRATAGDLRAIAAAIAAGPNKRRNVLGRFTISWQGAAPLAVDGKLEVGDPHGASFTLDAGKPEPKAVFLLADEQTEADLGWGRVTLGVRLGSTPAVTWKAHGGIGVDSGRYGVWSPNLAMPDKLDKRVIKQGKLGGLIQSTAEGDCGFPSLLGLDANKRPVAFLFGESLYPAVFGVGARR